MDADDLTGDRLKEHVNINKSISIFNGVVKVLAKKATGGAKNLYLPYRDSLLTQFVMPLLCGNSKTTLLATIRPSSAFYSDTLDVLKIARMAKSIKNEAVVNESEVTSNKFGGIQQSSSSVATGVGSKQGIRNNTLGVPSQEELKRYKSLQVTS